MSARPDGREHGPRSLADSSASYQARDTAGHPA